jgi:hypothetical protein
LRDQVGPYLHAHAFRGLDARRQSRHVAAQHIPEERAVGGGIGFAAFRRELHDQHA